jgi:hypothetical protein
MSSATEKPRDFEPIEDHREMLALLVEGAKITADTLIWTKNQENVLHSRISLLSTADEVIYAWIPTDFSAQPFAAEIEKKLALECFFSVSLSRANLFFKTQYISQDSAGLQFKIPSQVYKVQRRKNLRFPIPDSYTLPVEFQDPLFPRKTIRTKVIDISASGLSFSAAEGDSPLFQSGAILKDLRFAIRGRLIQVDAEIRHVRPFHKQLIKVGLAFQGLQSSDSSHIASYVFDENRKFFSRFL